ncbi:hypothetical protein KC950_02045 [Candidatus Saccharibacteria bacterium]|nr:hypothetical protein [Candidatus Saccharibacteria bacterium]
MKETKDILQEQRDFWAQSAEYDKVSYKLSAVIALGGIGLIGIGIYALKEGDVVNGFIALGAGSGLAYSMGKLGMDEIQDFADDTAKVALVEHELEQLQQDQ